jgi:hypothetical protein
MEESAVENVSGPAMGWRNAGGTGAGLGVWDGIGFERMKRSEFEVVRQRFIHFPLLVGNE